MGKIRFSSIPVLNLRYPYTVCKNNFPMHIEKTLKFFFSNTNRPILKLFGKKVLLKLFILNQSVKNMAARDLYQISHLSG